MQGFHGYLSPTPVLGALSHFGSLEAATHRLESIFANQIPKVLTESGFFLFDPSGTPYALKSEEEMFADFGRFMAKTTIHEVNLEIKKPLRLKDCWGEDPIGSGGTDLFSEDQDLPPAQIKSLRALFNPFSGIVYPDQIDDAVRKKKIHIRAIGEQIARSPLFTEELEKRKNRLGDRYKKDHPYEVVWTDLTRRLRKWAMENSYDSFVYHNDSEGHGDCHVPLKKNQVLEILKTYAFDPERFQALIPEAVNRLRARFQESSRQAAAGNPKKPMVNAFLYGIDVATLWKPAQP